MQLYFEFQFKISVFIYLNGKFMNSINLIMNLIRITTLRACGEHIYPSFNHILISQTVNLVYLLLIDANQQSVTLVTQTPCLLFSKIV